jgi:hypothetical protein
MCQALRIKPAIKNPFLLEIESSFGVIKAHQPISSPREKNMPITGAIKEFMANINLVPAYVFPIGIPVFTSAL